MNGEEFKNLYTLGATDESITPFENEVGFSLIRKYPEGTAYQKDDKRMFIKIAVLERGFFYEVNMTKPEKRGENISYVITDGEEYKQKVTNFISDGSEFTFNDTTKKIVHCPTNKIFTMNELVEILAANHLSDRLFLKRIWNEAINGLLKFLFWLSDAHYERIRVMIDKHRYERGENLSSRDEKKNIEPFFKYFYISKNILFSTLLITFPSAFFLGYLWTFGEFSLSNPSLVLLFFLILFLCEKISILLDRKIKEFIMPVKAGFTEKKINFIEKMHNYQYRNKFNLRLSIRNGKTANLLWF